MLTYARINDFTCDECILSDDPTSTPVVVTTPTTAVTSPITNPVVKGLASTGFLVTLGVIVAGGFFATGYAMGVHHY